MLPIKGLLCIALESLFSSLDFVILAKRLSSKLGKSEGEEKLSACIDLSLIHISEPTRPY